LDTPEERTEIQKSPTKKDLLLGDGATAANSKQYDRKRRHTACIARELKHVHRRAFSESQLWDVTPRNFEKGKSYYYMTAGDVDAMSYVKLIIRQQPLDYLLISTWTIACEDIQQVREWIEDGRVKTVDFFVSELYPKNYRQEWRALKQLTAECGGRAVFFKNHSKCSAGSGPKFDFVVQSSANFNTNPRTEDAVVTIDTQTFQFFKNT